MIGSKRIRNELNVDPVVVVPDGADVVAIEVVSFLHNDSDDHWAVGGTDPHAWQVIDESQRMIFREAAEAGPSVEGALAHAGALIPARLSLREAATLEVPARKLKDGRRYVVRHLHWGHAAEAQFVVLREPKTAARTATAKAAPKAAKKRAAKPARKTAKRKAAKRKK